jgi:hypothetical protein
MKTRLGCFVLAAGLLVPSVRVWADYDKKEIEADEKTESREHQLAEEKEAMDRYNAKVAKYGADSAQAKKAWKHAVAEYKEHGDTPPAPDTAAAPATTK